MQVSTTERPVEPTKNQEQETLNKEQWESLTNLLKDYQNIQSGTHGQPQEVPPQPYPMQPLYMAPPQYMIPQYENQQKRKRESSTLKLEQLKRAREAKAEKAKQRKLSQMQSETHGQKETLETSKLETPPQKSVYPGPHQTTPLVVSEPVRVESETARETQETTSLDSWTSGFVGAAFKGLLVGASLLFLTKFGGDNIKVDIKDRLE